MSKPNRKSAKQNVKAGTSAIEAQARRRLFCKAYLANGRNGTQAAITAGFAPNSAGVTASRLLQEAYVIEYLAAATKEFEAITGLTAERTLREVARLAYFDPRRTVNGDGTLKALHELDDDTAAAVASEKTTIDGDAVTTTDRKFHDKNAALEKAMKHHGLYEKDTQAKAGVDVTIRFVGGTPRAQQR